MLYIITQLAPPMKLYKIYGFRTNHLTNMKKWLLGKPPNKQNVRFYRPSPRPKAIGIFPKHSSDTIINCCVGICWYGKSPIRWYVDKVPYIQGLYISVFIFIFIVIQIFEYTQSSRIATLFSEFHLKNLHSHTTQVQRKDNYGMNIYQ